VKIYRQRKRENWVEADSENTIARTAVGFARLMEDSWQGRMEDGQG